MSETHLPSLRELLMAGEPARALHEARQALDRNAQDAEAAFVAAAALEDLDRHAEAFVQFARANAIFRTGFAYDRASDEAVFESLRRTFARELPLNSDSTIAGAPLFVVGLPRTGATLVDGILTSHPQVSAAGELQAMPVAVKQLAGTSSRRLLDVPTIAGLTGRSAHALGELYLARARPNAGTRGPRFVDRFPLNFLYIGWIIEALPYADIVCLRRGAMDSVWSNFTHLFGNGVPHCHWSYDLMDTARYVLMFQRLMAFWRQRFPGRIHEVSYEHLVADPEVQTRRMLTHCGIGWDPACLEFQRTPPVLGRWRNHETQLSEVMDFFTANGIPLD